MRCERHGLAAGPDGHCALCKRERRNIFQSLERYHGRGARWVARTVVAVLVGIVTYVVLLLLFDRAPR